MTNSINSNGGQVAASNADEAAADAEASRINCESGAVPASEADGEQKMKETNTADTRTSQALEPVRAEIPLNKIDFNVDLFPRVHVDGDAVAEYSEAILNGAEFPPIDVFKVGGRYWLSDGRHRYEASRKARKTKIWAKVYQGTQRDAVLHSLEANTSHGVRRTNADKRKTVMILFQDSEWRGWGDVKIARRCNVSADLVKSVRAEYERAHPEEAQDGKGRLVERGGKVYHQKTPRPEAAKPRPGHLAAIAGMMDMARSARVPLSESGSELAESLNRVGDELHEILGKATGAERMTDGVREPLNVYNHALEGGIKATPEFEMKGLATHAVNVGLGCGHQCTYCSSQSMRCRLPAYGELQINPYDRGYAVIDTKTAERILKDMPKLGAGDTVMLSTLDDAWSPEARKHGVGRKSLEALLKNTPARIRILTKSAEVAKDFDVIKGFEKRVMVGISIGIPESRENVAAAVEPNASPVRERLKALTEAHNLKLRIYAMLCPCLPGVADSEAALTEMFKAVKVRGAEDIWLEPVNARGKALGNTVTALRLAGLRAEADAVDAIRTKEAWSKYATALTENAVKVAEAQGVLGKLKILLYTDRFTDADREQLKQHKAAVIWLGKDKDGKPAEAAGEDKPEADTADTEGGTGSGRTEAA